MKFRAHSGACLTVLAFCLAQPANAQAADDQNSPSGSSGQAKATDTSTPDGQLGDIVVTAQRREEKLQDVPVAVTAFSADALETKGVTSVMDLAKVTPGLVFPSGGIGGSPRIRGVGTQFSIAGNENSVATYVDGVYYPAAGANLMFFNNIDQVAVLKGPQGTLFGRNATGGLIQITTRDPSQDFQGRGEIGYGNLDTVTATGYVTGGLTQGLAADLAVTYKNQHDGFGENLFNGKDVNKSKFFAARSKWKADLGDSTTATLIVDYSRYKAAEPAYRPEPGSLPLTGVPFSGGKWDVDSDTQPFIDSKDYGVSLNLSHELTGVRLVSISAYRYGKWETAFDSESLTLPIFSLYGILPDKMFSQEFQALSTSNGPLKWVAGIYYYNRKGGSSRTDLIAPLLGFFQNFHTDHDTDSYAGYGQATYNVSKDTAITLGVRLTTEKKSYFAEGVYSNLSPAFDVPLGPTKASKNETKLTWRAAIDHHFSDDVMVYASYNRGFKSGGYDPGNVTVANYIKPEVLDAFEIGSKADFLDKRLRLNTAVYYYDFKDIQLNTFVNGLPSVYNGKSAKLYGFDLDLAAMPVDGLTFTAGLAYVHDRFGDFPIARTATVPTGGIVQLPDISADGKRLPNTPDWTVNLGVEYRVPIGTTELTLAGDYAYSSKWYNAPENRTFQPDYSLFNASATLSFADDRYMIRVWGRNLGNKAYYAQLFNQVPVSDVVDMADGRTYGLTLGTKF